MQLSEYIRRLQQTQEQYGDLPVCDSYDQEPAEPEEVEGSIVLADTF